MLIVLGCSMIAVFMYLILAKRLTPTLALVLVPPPRRASAPPGLAPADRDELVALVADARESDVWREAVARNGWTSAPLDGDAFGAFLDAETAAPTPPP